MDPGHLPPTMESRFADFGRRIQLQQLARAACRAVLIMLGAAVAAIAADFLVILPGTVRLLLLLGWILLGLIFLFQLIYVSRRLPSPELLAATIEARFPRLAERLSTAVGLSGQLNAAHGSPFLVNLVVHDADVRTGKLDLNRAAPLKPTLIAVGACGIALIAVAISLFTVPSATVHARRFIAPWHQPEVEQAFTLRVTSGDPTVKRGESTTLSAVFEPLKSGATLPTSGVALIKAGDRTERVPMTVDGEKREIYLTRGPLDADFEYRIVAEPAASEWHKVTVLDPVRLESARVIVVPPVYARRPGEEPVTAEGLGDVHALQFSTVSLQLNFNRTPSAAWIEWKPDNAESTRVQPAGRFAVPLDGVTSTVSLPARANGEYRLHAEVAKLKTPFRPMAMRVVIDTPPRFESVAGVINQPRFVRPEERAKIEAVVSDDFGLSGAELELRVSGRTPVTVPLQLISQGPERAAISHVLDLGKIGVNEGDLISYRLIAADNRRMPEAKLEPQRTCFPPEGGWAELKVQRDAAPLKQQEIVAQRNSIEDRLRHVSELLDKQQKALRSLRLEVGQREVLKFDQADRLDELRGRVGESGELLDELARDIGMSSDLAGIGEAVREVAERDVRPAAGNLRQAQRDPKPGPRGQNMTLADKSLQEAVRRLAAVREANERLANLRLEMQKIDDIAEEERALAEEAENAPPEKLAEIRRRQQELEERLRKLQDESEPLRNAVNALRQQFLKQTAERAGSLEQDVRRLNEAMRNLDGAEREGKVGAIVRQQEDLVQQAVRLAGRSDSAAKAAALEPLRLDELTKALEAVKSGNLHDAVDQQERAAFELDRLADELEKAVARSRDPRETARQLERLQEHLRQQLIEAVKDTPFDLVPKDRRGSLVTQQRALRKAVDLLSIPRDAVEVRQIRQIAVELAGDAADCLSRIDAANADDRMSKSRDALAKLAEALPTRERRLAAARSELTRLKQEQDAIAQSAEREARLLDKLDPDTENTQQELARKAAPFAARQQEAADRLSKLDLPGHQERQAKAASAMRRAKDDLDSGRPHDLGPSLQAARRELERLEQAIAGQTPTDEQVDRLAKRQREIADRLQKNVAQPDPKRTRELQRLQSELADELSKLQAPEAPASRDDALTLSREAQNAATPEEAARQAAEAADSLQRLADQVNGRDSEAEKVDRLAKKQKAAAEEADRLAKKKEPSADLRRRSQKLLDEARQLRPGDAGQKDKQKAIDALNRAQQATTPEQMAKAQAEAAESLQRLAERLQVRGAIEPMREQLPEKTEGLPTPEMAEDARRLARQQRILRDELARTNEAARKEQPPSDQNPLQDLIKEEEKIADEARRLAAQAERNDSTLSEEAREAANRTAERLKNGATASARDAGRETAAWLQKLAKQSSAKSPQNQAAELARRQADLNQKLDAHIDDKAAARSQQAERQKQLREQAGQFAKDLQQMAEQMKSERLEQAAGQAGKSEEAMKQAIDQNAKNQAEMSRASQDQAADALQKARQMLRDAAKAMDQKDSASTRQIGRSVEDARDQMQKAQQQLGEGKPGEARGSMRQAADNLRKAGRQVGRSNNPLTTGGSEPNGNDGQGSTPADLRPISAITEKYPGKSWGELPGEVRNQIISDLKARYGEDFAKYIKLYFEQLAERK